MAPSVLGRVLTPYKIQDAVAATGNGAAVTIGESSAVGGYAVGCFQITGTFSNAVVNFEATLDGSTWVALETVSVGNSATIQTSTSGSTTGIFRFNALGLYQVRARVTWTTGTSVTVWVSLIA